MSQSPSYPIESLHIYPIKSLAGIQLHQSEANMRGLAYDRRWILIDSENQFLSQRSNPEMALLQPILEGQQMSVVHRRHSEQRVDIPLEEAAYVNKVKTSVWGTEVSVYEAPPLVNQWFSDMLSADCRLAYMKSDSIRLLDPRYAPAGMEGSLADGYPFLLANTASLDFLNQHLTQSIPMNRFRPNIVFKGQVAFEEDHWSALDLGNMKFRGVKPCGRCQIITIDQDTLATQKEVLTQLAKHRKAGNKVLFGECLILESNPGIVKVGDSLQVISHK